MTVAVSGANGFTGRFVCRELSRRRIPHLAVLRPGTDSSWFQSRRIPFVYADLNCQQQLTMALSGCTALLNIASIGFGAAPSIIQACINAGVQRAVFVSTTAIFTQLNPNSKAVRLSAEAAIIASGLDSTILRPTMIYGTPADRNMIRLVRWLSRCSVLPVFGNGHALQQPVHVSDVAWAVVQSLETPSSIGRQLNISGSHPLTFNDVVRLTAAALGRNVYLLHLPCWPFLVICRLAESLRIRLPIKKEQILRLNEDKVFMHDEATSLLGFSPLPFDQGIEQEVALFRSGNSRPSQ